MYSPKALGVFGGALPILLGSAVLVGWTIHSSLLIQLAPNLAPMQPIAAVSFILAGFALLGIVTARLRLTVITSAIVWALAVFSLLENLLGAALRIAPVTAICFIVLATGFAMTQVRSLSNKSAILGVTGLLVAAVGASCGIGILWGS